MPCFKRKLLALAVFALLTLFPSVSFAATQKACDCFCGEDGFGAIDQGPLTNDACQKVCSRSGIRFVGCFADAAEHPSESDKCWTQDECASWSEKDRNGNTATADWGAIIPFNCSFTKTSGKEMRYCYGKDAPYKLNITIGNVTEIQNLAEYVNVIYAWLLPAAALVAVVMMMIGGLQYVLSRGKEKYISKSKERITNAITGLVLLLSIFVILNLIDPRLTSLNSLKVPLIKEVTILDSESSCERLQDYGYGVEPQAGFCGNKGKINDISELKDNAIGSWELDDPCDFQKCKSGNDMICLSTGVCASCGNNPTPTASTCAALQVLNTGANGGQQIYCSYDAAENSCIGVTADAELGSFSCDSMKATAVGTGCEYYQTLKIVLKSGMQSIASEKGKEMLKEICNRDPCKLAAAAKKDGKTGNRCAYNEGSHVEEWFWGAYTTVEAGFYCHTF